MAFAIQFIHKHTWRTLIHSFCIWRASREIVSSAVKQKQRNRLKICNLFEWVFYLLNFPLILKPHAFQNSYSLTEHQRMQIKKIFKLGEKFLVLDLLVDVEAFVSLPGGVTDNSRLELSLLLSHSMLL